MEGGDDMEALKEALKEAARVVLIAIIPIILMGVDTVGHVIHIDWFLVGFTAIITGLRFLDSLLHEQGKATGNDNMAKGLTRF